MDPAGLRKLEEEVKALRGIQAQMQQVASQQETLMTQQNENQLVMKELELIKGDRPVYKLVGPVLVKQDLAEAKDTITKRLEYIKKQMVEREAHLRTLSQQAAARQKIVCVQPAPHSSRCCLQSCFLQHKHCTQIREMQAALIRNAK